MKKFIVGARASIPIAFGFIPVGIAYALLAKQAGLTSLQTCLMSLGVFAGAAQIMAVGMISQGALLSLIILATFILNLRHFIMSTCIMKKLKSVSLPKKMIAAFGITDETFSVFTSLKQETSFRFFLGLMLGSYLSWNLGTWLGVLFSDFMPVKLSASFGIALYALFIALLIPSLSKNQSLGLLSIGSALINALFSLFLSSSTALILSTLIGAWIGTFFIQWKEEEDLDEF